MSKPRRPVKSRRQLRGPLAALLAAASLLGGALALAPSPALAMTDENNECANLSYIWEQLVCEEDHAGSGDVGSSTTANSGGTASKPPTPTHSYEPIFDSDFDESNRSWFDKLFESTRLERLSRTYATCRHTWMKARRASHRNPHHVLAWLIEDPNDSWIQDELSERWEDNRCSQVFDPIGMP